MLTQRVGQLSPGDEFTPDNGVTWMTVKETWNVCSRLPRGRNDVLLVVTDGGKRWWGNMNEMVIIR